MYILLPCNDVVTFTEKRKKQVYKSSGSTTKNETVVLHCMTLGLDLNYFSSRFLVSSR